MAIAVLESAVMETPCIPWEGKLSPDGYGQFTRDMQHWLAHRWSFTQAKGPIPPGLCVDHECRNRACISPEHLRLKTRGANAVENSIGITAVNKAKTHCKHGHEFTSGNTYEHGGARICRTCLRNNHLRHRARADVKAKRAARAREQRRAVS